MTAAPDWYRQAMTEHVDDCYIDVDGCTIHYLAWGSPGRPGVLFVHGGGAHAHWWTHLAPLFTADYRVAAIDLSGHGDSEHRAEGYQLDQWAEEVMAVADDASIAGPPVLVGHSMGGMVTIATGARFSGRLAGIAVLDSPVRKPADEVSEGGRAQMSRAKVHPDWATAISRFRTIPEQLHYEPYLMEHIARMSLKEVDGGVTWKFDPNRRPGDIRHRVPDMLGAITCRVAVFRAQYGSVTKDIGEHMYELLGRVAPVIEIPLAGHHLMLDQPLLVVTALRTLLADWEHSVPFERR